MYLHSKVWRLCLCSLLQECALSRHWSKNSDRYPTAAWRRIAHYFKTRSNFSQIERDHRAWEWFHVVVSHEVLEYLCSIIVKMLINITHMEINSCRGLPEYMALKNLRKLTINNKLVFLSIFSYSVLDIVSKIVNCVKYKFKLI